MTDKELDVDKVLKRLVVVTDAFPPTPELATLAICLGKDIRALGNEVQRLKAIIADLRHDAEHDARR